MSEDDQIFYLYPKDFLGSVDVNLMSAEQLGAYLLLLCFEFTNGAIPPSKEAIATLCRVSVDTLDEWGESDDENIVLSKFEADEITGLLVSSREAREQVGIYGQV